jgi:hypothetical protein
MTDIIQYKAGQAVPKTTEELRYYLQTELERITAWVSEVQKLLDGDIENGEFVIQPVETMQFAQNSTLDRQEARTSEPGDGIQAPANDVDTRSGIFGYGSRRGMMWYDDFRQQLSYYVEDPDVAIGIGRELVYRCAYLQPAPNPLTPGTLVKVVSAFDGFPLLDQAQADTVANSNVLGMVTGNISQFNFGYVTAFGTVSPLDTEQDSDGNSPINEGDIVYLSENNAGGWTIVPPDGIVVPVGIVTNVDDAVGTATGFPGSIAISINRATELASDRDVTIDTPGLLDVLAYDNQTSLWRNTNYGTFNAFHAKFTKVVAVTNPSIANDFNIASCVRTGLGQYTVTLDEAEVFFPGSGFNWLSESLPSFQYLTAAGNDIKEALVLSTNPGAGTFVMQVYVLNVAGNRVNYSATDMQDGDAIALTAIYAPAAGRDPATA